MNELTRFKIGHSVGRPRGAKNKLANSFVEDVASEWERSGPQILKVMAAEDPSRFAELVAKVCPRDINVLLTPAAPVGLDEHDLAILRAIRQEVDGANELTPAEVFDHVLRAIRAYGAKTIDNSD